MKKPKAKAKPAHHPKPAAASNHVQQELEHLQNEVTDLQHHAKHQPAKKHAAAKKPAKHKAAAKHGQKVGQPDGEGVACCAAEAVAASLRLAGHQVTGGQVLELHQLAGGGDDDGVSIGEALSAAWLFGLAGRKPADMRHIALDGPLAGSLIVGLELPGGPHAVTVDPGGQVWSWGERVPLASLQPQALIDAWVVTW